MNRIVPRQSQALHETRRRRRGTSPIRRGSVVMQSNVPTDGTAFSHRDESILDAMEADDLNRSGLLCIYSTSGILQSCRLVFSGSSYG